MLLLRWLQRVGADLLVKSTDQDGVYYKDPRKHADAVKLDKLSFEDLPKIFDEKVHKAGMHQIIDPEAVKVLKRHRVKLIVQWFYARKHSLSGQGRKGWNTD